MKPLPQSFFARNTVDVAKDLLGKIISVNGFKGRIVETEAYGRDPASHAYKKTEKDQAGAVLIRAVEPLNRLDQLKKKRNTDNITNICSGPGKLCQAFGIS